MKTIQLSKGKEALVDDEDYEYLSQWKWYYNRGYAVRGANPKILMHRIVNNTPIGLDTDHINRNGLDNRKCNLRNATRQQNVIYRNKQKNNKSGYKGVSWHKHSNKWIAYVIINKKTKTIGYFKDIMDAVSAFDKKSKELFGEFAYLNIR